MAIRLLNEAQASSAMTNVYTEIKLIITVAERSWSSADPVDKVADAVAEKVIDRAFDTDRFKKILADAGYTVISIDEELVDGSLSARKRGNEATVYAIVGVTCALAENMTPDDAKKLASVISRNFPLGEMSYPLAGIVINGYPLNKSDLDKQDADIECYISSLSIESEGKGLYFS